MPRVLIALFALLALAPVPLSAQAAACADYDAFEWAQTVYESDPSRYAALDPDGDGIACPELPNGAAPALWTDRVPADAEPVQLSRVVDGDTAAFIFSNGTVESVRFLLIDTPETVHPSQPVGCYGAEASAFTTWLLSLGGDIYLERDISDRDRFDRLLRYVWLDFGGGEVYLVNEAIARSGYGQVSTFPPDVEYVDRIRAGTAFAREHQLGLWGACSAFGVPAVGQAPVVQAPSVPAPAVAPPPSAPAPVVQQPVPAPAGNCDPSYPTLCLPSFPDLDCGEITARRFPVLSPDPHGFDGDGDGVGCESG
ncbi:MAG: thermonuclease family protein [Chloroflexota bacterium]|nr:thermonuclease family protein [Chloroflexota bacterium]